MTETNVIDAKNLVREFNGKRVINRVSFGIKEGEIFGFLGPNGAGKTTTVRLLSGVLAPTEGSAWVMGYDVRSEPLEVRKVIGVLTETSSLYEKLSAKENLAFFGHLYGLDGEMLNNRINELLQFFGLQEKSMDKVGTFSTGMKKRLSLARALFHDPPVLFLDEPTSGLDPEGARLIRNHINELSKEEKRTIFLCTHNLEEAKELCSRVAIIDNGKIIAIGSPEDLERDLWQKTEVEVNLDEANNEMLKFIRELEIVMNMRIDKEKIFIELGSQNDIPVLVEEIVHKGGRIFSVNQVSHSLEEIYFRIREEKK